MGFDGKEKDFFKKYFKPQLLKGKNLCEKEKLIGEWTVMFKGYDMAKLHFEMLPDILPNQEDQYIECAIAYEIDPTVPGIAPPSEVMPGSKPDPILKDP